MIDKFFAIDLDRTLINTDLVMELVEKTCKNIGVKYDSIEIKKLASEQRGLSYEPISYIESLGGDIASEFKKEFLKISFDNDLLYPDAHRFISRINKKSIDFLILTFGPKPWQSLKLEASKLINNPYIITDNQDKAEVVSEWYDGHLFVSPFKDISAKKHVVLVDDKPKAFMTNHPDCIGFLIDRKNEFATKKLNDQVSLINSLDEIAV